MEYTKGEWGYRGILPIGFHIYSKNTNNPIAVGIENEANAHLIASAPDLYEAGKRVLPLLTGAFYKTHDIRPEIIALREALAKVKNEVQNKVQS